MEKVILNAEERERAGKGAARSLRRKGLIPAVLYRGGSSMPIQLDKKELAKFIHTTAGEHVMVRLQFQGGEHRLVLMKDYQVDPVRGDLLHTDFFEVSLSEEVRVTVGISTTGEPIGVKRDGGILQYGIREIEIQCLPDKMPPHLEIDVSHMEIGKSIHVGDLTLGEGIRVLTEPGELVATVTAPAVEEAAAAPITEVVEPEVVRKGKKEEEAGQ
jgi:large subunit ribosomal protein L25